MPAEAGYRLPRLRRLPLRQRQLIDNNQNRQDDGGFLREHGGGEEGKRSRQPQLAMRGIGSKTQIAEERSQKEYGAQRLGDSGDPGYSLGVRRVEPEEQRGEQRSGAIFQQLAGQ